MGYSVEKISVALPPEMVTEIKGAVASGSYASASEVVRDALRDWTYKRSLKQKGIEELRSLWLEAIEGERAGVSADEVLNRLERKYQVMAAEAGE